MERFRSGVVVDFFLIALESHVGRVEDGELVGWELIGWELVGWELIGWENNRVGTEG